MKAAQIAWLWQPVGEIRDYFGDGVALYFAFLGEYTKSLIFPAAFGFMAFLSQALSGEGIDGNPLTIPFTAYMALYVILFQCSWTRRENELKFLWSLPPPVARWRPYSIALPKQTFVGRFLAAACFSRKSWGVRFF